MVLQRPETLTRAAVRYISEAILRGDFAPGQPLPDVHLADQMGTSRSTLREAAPTVFSRLGGAEIQTNRGTHGRMPEADKSGDPDGAATAIREHSTQAGELLVNKLSDSEKEGD